MDNVKGVESRGNGMIIAIDFDGTCVTHEFPAVGRDIGAVPVLKAMVDRGDQLILFTMRNNIHTQGIRHPSQAAL